MIKNKNKGIIKEKVKDTGKDIVNFKIMANVKNTVKAKVKDML